MPNYELKYLNIRGRGEQIRWILHYLNLPFKDTTIDRALEWPRVKDQMPFKQVPILIVDDGKLVLAQSTAIMRYLGKKHGLEAKTTEDQALCDMYAEFIQDIIINIRPWVWSITKNLTAEEREERFNTLFIPQITENFGPAFEKQLEKNGTGYLVGDAITWVDFMLAEWSDKVVTIGKSDILDKSPKILAHRKMVMSSPSIQDYIKTRPKEWIF